MRRLSVPLDPFVVVTARTRDRARPCCRGVGVGGAVTASSFLGDFPRFTAQAVRYALAALVLLVVGCLFAAATPVALYVLHVRKVMGDRMNLMIERA